MKATASGKRGLWDPETMREFTDKRELGKGIL